MVQASVPTWPISGVRKLVRGLGAGAGAAWLVLVGAGLADAVDTYAWHLCRWPARISCHEGVFVWRLVPIGFGLVATGGIVALATWAWTGRHGVLAWLFPVWTLGFGWLILAMGPRRFGADDLVVVGLYAGLGIEMLRRTASTWFPTRRLWLGRLAIVAWALYGGVLLAVPFVLAWAARRSGLS